MSQLSQLPPNANINVNNINPPSPAESTSTNTKKRPSPSSASNTPSIPPPTTPHATTFGDSTGSSRKGPTISRSIQACNRCRARKTRCDQRFPSCSACLKAGVECVGIDAATGREIPRSYVDWLEKRVKHLEEELKLEQANGDERIDPALKVKEEREEKQDKALHLRPDIENLVNQVGVVGVQGTSAEGFMGGSSGISFARLMFSAVKLKAKDGTESATPTSNTPPLPYAPQESSSDIAPDPAASSTTIPRSLKRSPPAPFPDRQTAENLIEIYFQQANPQFPILFRPIFEPIFKRAVDRVELEGTATPNGTCDQYGNPILDRIQHSADLYFAFMCFAIASAMSQASENLPERYHAAAMMHMDSLFMSVAFSNNRLDGLKGVLLLALYSLMRPAAPGVWYVLGAALRLAVDMGLHQENARTEKTLDPVTIDERRRLFWCTYSLDRQVCVYLGRPFGISDDAIKTPFPVDVDDEFITPSGIRPMPPGRKSSRTVSLHMFRIRQLQSEIQQILYQTSEVPRRFANLDAWRHDMEQRLQYWIDTAPKTQGDAGCGYNLSFVDLNYQQTRLLLNGLCPAVPQPGPQAYQIIADAGSRIIKAYRHLHREKSINYSWLACHNLFMAGTSYLCALWQSPLVRSNTTIDQIDFHTLACVDVLSSMIPLCPAAQTCRDVFDNLASSTVQLCSSEYTRPVKRVRLDEWVPPASFAGIVNVQSGWYGAGGAGAGGPHGNSGGPGSGSGNGAGGQQDWGNGGHHHQDWAQGMQVPRDAGMDGRGLFEMIQEVGSSGAQGMGMGWDGWLGAGDGWAVLNG